MKFKQKKFVWYFVLTPTLIYLNIMQYKIHTMVENFLPRMEHQQEIKAKKREDIKMHYKYIIIPQSSNLDFLTNQTLLNVLSFTYDFSSLSLICNILSLPGSAPNLGFNLWCQILISINPLHILGSGNWRFRWSQVIVSIGFPYSGVYVLP